jgi:hypothetical protein
LIVDANAYSLVLGATEPNDFTPVWNALRTRRAIAVYGGKLAVEYARVGRLAKLLVELDRQGIFRQAPLPEIEKAQKAVIREGQCRSNDHHIIALARVSGVRLLCSADAKLGGDFRNGSILHPRGSVYKNPSHERLIAKHCGDRVKRSGRGKRRTKG